MPCVGRRLGARATRPASLKRWATVALVGLAFLAAPPLVRTSSRALAACAKWISVAAGFELLSMLGFVLVFGLVFGASASAGAGASKRLGLGAGLRALGAITLLPGGGVVGPGLAARSSCREPVPVRSLARSTFALTILTNAPAVLVLGLVSLSLWLGWFDGPHDALRTLPAAGGAAVSVALAALSGRSRGAPPVRARRLGLHHVATGLAVVGDGAAEARALLGGRNWRLAGAVAYYAFDNAVLWAAFHAYGRAPAASVVVMGYVVGSLATVLPLPAGIGAVDGGLFGALVLYGAPVAPAAGAVLIYRGVSLSLPVILSGLAWAPAPVGALRARRKRRSGAAVRSA